MFSFDVYQAKSGSQPFDSDKIVWSCFRFILLLKREKELSDIAPWKP